MLQKFRKKIGRFMLWAIVIIISASFVMWGGSSTELKEKCVAKIDGYKITQLMIEKRIKQINKFNQQRSNIQEFNETNGLYTTTSGHALNTLINDAIINQHVKNNFYIDENTVLSAISTLPIFKASGEFSKEKFMYIMSNIYNLEPAEYLSILQNSLLTDQLYYGIEESSFVLPSELENYLLKVNCRLNFEYLIINKDSLINDISVTDIDVKDFYEKNFDEFKTDNAVKIEYLYLDFNDLVKSIDDPSSEQLESFFKENISLYTEGEKQWRVAVIQVEYLNNNERENAKDVARKVYKIADNFEQYKCIERESFVGVKSGKDEIKIRISRVHNQEKWRYITEIPLRFRETILDLDELCESTSVPREIKNGYEIIKIIETKQKKVTQLKKIKKRVILDYKSKIANEQFAGMSNELTNVNSNLLVSENSLENASKKTNIGIKRSGLITVFGGDDFIANNPLIINEIFKEKENISFYNSGNLIQLDNHSIIMFRIYKTFPPKRQEFDYVKEQVAYRLKEIIVTNVIGELCGATMSESVCKSDVDMAIIRKYNLKTNKLSNISLKDILDNKVLGEKNPEILENLYKAFLSIADSVHGNTFDSAKRLSINKKKQYKKVGYINELLDGSIFIANVEYNNLNIVENVNSDKVSSTELERNKSKKFLNDLYIEMEKNGYFEILRKNAKIQTIKENI